jgi:microcompartment protein CcmK/EutM
VQLARVIGEIVSSIKDANLNGVPLLILQPIAASGEPLGRTLVALDSVGAGVGEHVFFVRGREAAFPFYPAEPPADAAIIGIVDHWDVETTAAGQPKLRNEPGTLKPDGKPKT